MANTTWLFGAGSPWSQRIKNNLSGEVIPIGRNLSGDPDITTIKYDPSNAEHWIHTVASDLPIPDRLIFNINTGPVLELEEDILKDVARQFQIFDDWWLCNKQQLFFKVMLVNWLIKEKNFSGDICYITSQISADHNPDWKHLHMYKNLRAMDYEIIWNNRNHGINAYGICPAANTRPMEWADYISNLIQQPDIGEHWLYGISEVDEQLSHMEWSDWQRD